MSQDEEVDPLSSARDEEQHEDDARRSLHDAAASTSTTTTVATSSDSPTGLNQANRHQDSSATLPSILENSSGHHVYTIDSFLERFVPTLSRILISDEILSMWKDLLLVVHTEDSLHQLTKFSVQNHESHASLLQDCIGFLVKERTKRYQTPNLLSAGFSLQERGSTTVHQHQLNAALDYLRTAPALVKLHEAVGDDVMRYILLGTSLFLKVHSNSENNNNDNNYWQLTGAPLTALSWKKQEQQVVHRKKTKRRKRKRAIQQFQDLKQLAPDQCVSRVGLFYSAQYTVKVGDRLLQKFSAESNQTLWVTMMQEYAAVFEAASKSIAAEEPPWCGELLKRHKRIDYPRLLEHYCPLPNKYQELLLAELTQQYSTTVVSFARACLSQLLPSTVFWGSEHNQKIFLQHTLASFVQLRRQERFPNKLLLKDLRVTQMSWLLPKMEKKCSRIDHERAKLLLLSVLRWILRDYLIPLLSECFYASEAEFGGLQVFFYRKPVWTRYRNLAMQNLLTKQYTELTEHEVATRLERQEMGLSGLRLLPKTTGVRPIATLRQREVLMLPIGTHSATMGQDDDDDDDVDDAALLDTPLGPARKKHKSDSGISTGKTNVPRPPRVPAPNQSRRSTNAMLGDCFDVLSFEYNRQKQTFGAGLMGLHHFHSRYRQFVCQWKQKNQDDKPLYFGSVDIHHCYDNIHQDHLLGIVENILREDEYVIQKYSILHPTDGDRVRHRRCKDVNPPEEMEPFNETVRVLAARHKDCVFVDGVHSVAVSKRQVVDQLREHLTSHLVVTRGRYGKRYLMQSQGIPQGSILSSLLCNSYYGDVEQRLQLSFSEDALLARMVDDFLMVTIDLSKLQRFFATMYRGDPALGVTINQDKTCSSVKVELPTVDDGTEATTIPSLSCRLFPWCGMLFDSSTGEIRNDYTRFAAIKGRDSLTVQLVSQEGAHLLRQMKLFVRPRCLPILFDPSINSLPTQVINFYQLVLFAAVKTAEYLSSIASSTQRTSDGKNRCAFPNARFLSNGIETTIKHAHSLIQGRLRKAYAEMHEGEHQLRTFLKYEMAVWLGWQAFYDVFRQLQQDLRGLAKQHFRPSADASFDRSMQADGDRRGFWKRTVSLALRDFDLPTLIDVKK